MLLQYGGINIVAYLCIKFPFKKTYLFSKVCSEPLMLVCCILRDLNRYEYESCATDSILVF